jgi:DNA replication protein DnaC
MLGGLSAFAASFLIFGDVMTVIVTTSLPFSEWTTKFPNTRLCKAMLDRLTDQAHIIETGAESYRFRRTLARKGGMP